MIITGAPVEKLDFEEVKYWDELVEIMEYTKTNVSSTLHICWSAQAALYYHYGIEKKLLDKKLSGVYRHKREKKNIELLRGIEENFCVYIQDTPTIVLKIFTILMVLKYLLILKKPDFF